MANHPSTKGVPVKRVGPRRFAQGQATVHNRDAGSGGGGAHAQGPLFDRACPSSVFAGAH